PEARGEFEPPDLGPIGPDGADETAHKAANLSPARPLAGPQHGGDKAAFPIKDDDRLEAVIVMVDIEEAELLSAMHSVEGVVDIEHDALRHRLERTAILLHQRPANKGQAVDVKQVGRELGVRYVLQGSVRKAG